MKIKTKSVAILTLVIMFFSFVSSCTKFENGGISDAGKLEVSSETGALENFAIALSKAACQHQEVRELIKSESLKKFDNDYDVLYQNVKTKTIADLGTFRDVLISYIGSESVMKRIESLLPSLTIYVTDVRWFDPNGFCAEHWDTKDCRMAVTYDIAKGKCEKLFSNGYYLGKIDPGTIPGGAVLIVKKNERIIATHPTKSGDITYTFKDDVFNGSLKRKIELKNKDHSGEYTTSWVEGEAPQSAESSMAISTLDRINPDIMKSYRMFLHHPYAVQNDYIYYGMTDSSEKGMLRTDVRSKIVRFKVDPDSFDALFDDSIGNDIGFSDEFEITDDGRGYEAQPSNSTIYLKLWADGALEFKLVILSGDSGQSGSIQDIFYDVTARELFTVKQESILREQWWSTPFKWYITWRYTMKNNLRDDTTLASKWYYPEISPFLPTWDLINNSSYKIMALEEDSGANVSHTITVASKKANQITGKVYTELSGDVGKEEGSLSGVFKNELGWSIADEETVVTEQTISYSNDDDELGTSIISFTDKYVERQINSIGVQLYSYGNSRFSFTILPYRY